MHKDLTSSGTNTVPSRAINAYNSSVCDSIAIFKHGNQMQHNGTKTNLFTDEQTIYFEIYLTEYEQFLYKVKKAFLDAKW